MKRMTFTFNIYRTEMKEWALGRFESSKAGSVNILINCWWLWKHSMLYNWLLTTETMCEHMYKNSKYGFVDDKCNIC